MPTSTQETGCTEVDPNNACADMLIYKDKHVGAATALQAKVYHFFFFFFPGFFPAVVVGSIPRARSRISSSSRFRFSIIFSKSSL